MNIYQENNQLRKEIERLKVAKNKTAIDILNHLIGLVELKSGDYKLIGSEWMIGYFKKLRERLE